MVDKGRSLGGRIMVFAAVILGLATIGSVIQGSIGPKTTFEHLRQNYLIVAVFLVLGVLSHWGGSYVSRLKNLEETDKNGGSN